MLSCKNKMITSARVSEETRALGSNSGLLHRVDVDREAAAGGQLSRPDDEVAELGQHALDLHPDDVVAAEISRHRHQVLAALHDSAPQLLHLPAALEDDDGLMRVRGPRRLLEFPPVRRRDVPQIQVDMAADRALPDIHPEVLLARRGGRCRLGRHKRRDADAERQHHDNEGRGDCFQHFCSLVG
jgi:hypothetical protein